MVKVRQFTAHAKSMYDDISDLREYVLNELNSEIKSDSIISIQEQYFFESETLELVVYYREEQG